MLTQREQRKSAKEFAKKWEGIGYEKGDSARFWLSLLNEVYGVEKPSDFMRFEDKIMLDHTGFIDGYIPTTHVLIEQKSIDKDLRKGIRQSDGSILSPFQQAKRYSIELPYDDRPRWIVLSNFKEFHIFDMNKPQSEPEVVYLKDLEEDFYRLNFLVDKEDFYIKKSTEVSIKAGELVGTLYDALLRQYKDPSDEEILKNLNVLCVRLVFCFYAEDVGLFGRHNMFYDYLKNFSNNPDSFRDALIKLFDVLDQEESKRDPYQSEDLLAFPYVNGGLFAKEHIVIPRLNEEIIDIILNKASGNFDWSKISPTIFGGVFESTLNPDTRRSGGMHYTSIENIHKVIDPLFMDEIREEFKEALALKTLESKKRRLENLQDKIASLKFLDPAAGSGNFLTETYISLRRLENKILKELLGNQIIMGLTHNPIKVSISQFYGIEINDFAVSVARTALWIAESQMMKETEDIVNMSLNFLPLKSYPNIVEGNALTMDWDEVVSKNELNYIMGNPPFVGYKQLSKIQKIELKSLYENMRSIDYVAGWYNKSLRYIQNSKIKCAFVSTNSITQGEAIQNIWEPLYKDYKFEIDFAYQSFIWKSDASDKASVHCVIISFSYIGNKIKKLFRDGTLEIVSKINPYLIEGDFIVMRRRSKPISAVSKMTKGAQLIDGDNFRITEHEKKEFINKGPEIEPYIYEYLNARTFINRTKNDEKEYCLYLTNCPPNIINKNSLAKDRVKRVKEFRENSSASTTQKLASNPSMFFQTQVPNKTNIVVPVVSSENRRYIPMDFMPNKVVYTNALFYVDNANMFEFGVLTSNVHMSWMRVFAGRLEMRYRYSNTLVYNTFPWPNTSIENKERIEKTANGILKARSLYPDSSLADLYDELTMPPELRKAHQENDKAVMEAYGFNWRNMTESECVAELMKLYQDLVNKENKK